jgi:hypothetical protein
MTTGRINQVTFLSANGETPEREPTDAHTEVAEATRRDLNTKKCKEIKRTGTVDSRNGPSSLVFPCFHSAQPSTESSHTVKCPTSGRRSRLVQTKIARNQTQQLRRSFEAQGFAVE